SAANLVRKIAENYKLPYYSISPTYSVCKSHGYIAGEKFICPFCGEKTEVYSRITGYYRPVQNWNDGKSEEYKHRKLYNIAESMANRDFVAHEQVSSNEACVECNDAKIILFATTTCPNCKMAEKFLGDAGVTYEKVYADQNPDLAKQFEIKQAPTLVIVNGNDVEKVMNVSNIRKFAENFKK
ncbi:MAG: ribonucleoside triphosphate reductase, partial [Ruminococcaceae bacterium]|nr:ribonucleoside triphosphate reductase [Oscillospiraceae bacterium]